MCSTGFHQVPRHNNTDRQNLNLCTFGDNVDTGLCAKRLHVPTWQWTLAEQDSLVVEPENTLLTYCRCLPSAGIWVGGIGFYRYMGRQSCAQDKASTKLWRVKVSEKAKTCAKHIQDAASVCTLEVMLTAEQQCPTKAATGHLVIPCHSTHTMCNSIMICRTLYHAMSRFSFMVECEIHNLYLSW